MEIKELLPSVQENISLAQHATFKVGGNAKYFFVAENKEDILKAIKAAKQCGLPFFILGGGSNILFPDEGLDGLVIKIQNNKLKAENNIIYTEAGVRFSEVVKLSEQEGLSGLEWASGIYGTIGGAIRGNAGAFGGQILDVVKTVEYFDIQKEKVEQCGVEECHFDYRTSVFKKNKNFIIISCELELKKGEKENIKQKIDSYKNYRVEHHPLNYPSAGSVFKNPEATEKIIKDYPEIVKNGIVPAGFLIEQAGLKGKVIGGAQISEKHCNFIINLGNATAKDILELIKIVKENVENKFKINLEEEIFVF